MLLDSVQSQANRLEEVLLLAGRERRLGRPHVGVPHLVVDFSGQKADGIDVSDLGQITSLETPHRVFDAILRDSELRGKPFEKSDEYGELRAAKPTNAMPVFRLSPTSLLFGAWNSFGEGGGLGAKFPRCVVSEIVGVEAREGERGAVRIDPVGIRKEVRVTGPKIKGGARVDPFAWEVAAGTGGERPSEIGHSNIPATKPSAGGTSIDYALHTAVVTCAGLRRLRFREVSDAASAHAVLAALALVALVEQEGAGYALRSRCDLVPEGPSAFEFVRSDGTTEAFELDVARAGTLLTEAVTTARSAGFPWDEKPIRLTPQGKLVRLIARSRAKALQGDPAEVDAGEA